MENLNIWDSKVKDNFHYFSSLDDILKYIKDKKITNFYVIDKDGLDNGESTIMYITALNESAANSNITVIYTDNSHEAFHTNFDDLLLSREFYTKYSKEINEAIIENMYESEYISINKYIYDENLVKNLILNAETISFQNGIDVPESIKKLLQDSHITSYSYQNGVRSELSTDMVLGQPYRYIISDAKTINLDPNITDLENLKLISSDKEIYISMYDEKKNTLDAFNNVYEIIKTLRENGQENKVTINVSSKKPFLDSKLYHSNLNYEVTGYDMENRKLEEIKEENNILDLMVKDIKTSNYSPFEKYLACYNITKKFKEYKENDEDRIAPRDIFRLLNNEYMVCVGYAKLLHELLYRVGIESKEWSIGVDTSYDAGFSMEEKVVENAGHARLIVALDDPKYNLHGFYVADPTWDNDLQEDYYNHALMNFDKTSMEYRLLSLTSEDLIINVKDENDFYDKINTLINDEMRNTFFNDMPYEEKYKRAIRNAVDQMLSILKDLKPSEYEKLIKEYRVISNGNYIEAYKQFIVKMGHIFIDNYAEDVSLDTIIDAAASVNKEVFGFDDEKAKEYHDYLYNKNLNMDKKSFPLYYEEKTKIA